MNKPSDIAMTSGLVLNEHLFGEKPNCFNSVGRFPTDRKCRQTVLRSAHLLHGI